MWYILKSTFQWLHGKIILFFKLFYSNSRHTNVPDSQINDHDSSINITVNTKITDLALYKPILWTKQAKSIPECLEYVHVTGSGILPLLELTKFSLVSFNRLLYEFNLAPMTGEVRDAIWGLESDATTMFGTIKDNEPYGIRKLIKAHGFSRGNNIARIRSTIDLTKKLDNLIKYGMGALTQFVADVLHAKQLGILPKKGPLLEQKVISAYIEKINILHDDMLPKIQVGFLFYKFIYVIQGKNHTPYKIFDLEFTEKFYKFCDEYFTKLKLPYNFSALQDNEQMPFVETFVNAIYAKYPGIESQISVKINRYTKKETLETKNSRHLNFEQDCADIIFYEMCNSFESLHGLNKFNLLASRDNKGGNIRLSAYQLGLFSSQFTDRITTIRFKLNFLIELLQGKIGQKLDAKIIAQTEPKVSYPVAFFLTRNDAHKITPCGYEFRSSHDLVLGSDIKHIGVSPNNFPSIQDFLLKNNLQDQVEIVDLETLQPIKKISISRNDNRSKLLIRKLEKSLVPL